jgi:hypothetical protein
VRAKERKVELVRISAEKQFYICTRLPSIRLMLASNHVLSQTLRSVFARKQFGPLV